LRVQGHKKSILLVDVSLDLNPDSIKKEKSIYLATTLDLFSLHLFDIFNPKRTPAKAPRR